jgi:Lrp/AsnC family transcriptional regulator, leucine-responsive regulatory protein
MNHPMNSRLTMKELGEKVHLTGPTVSATVAKLLIESFKLIVHPKSVDLFYGSFFQTLSLLNYISK